jgi:D-galactarolactone cycloisomerase
LATVRITDVTAIPITFPFDREPLSLCFVRIETDEGLVGWGEVCDSYGCTYGTVVEATIRDAYAPLLVGEEVDAVEPLSARLRAWTRRRLGDQWVGAYARAGVELALWDLVGRRDGRSVSGLVGRVRDRVAVYASGPFLEEGPVAWHLDVLGPLLDRGVTLLKVRVGHEWRRDLDTLAELRGALGDDVEIMIDGSEIFTLPTALAVADSMADLGVRWFEEPLPQSERAGIEELGRRSAVPIAYGEHLYSAEEAVDGLRRREFSVLQPDAATVGLIEARRMAQSAALFGARVVPHVCAGPVALAAGLHLAATIPAVRAIEYPLTLAPGWEALGTNRDLLPEAVVDGTIAVPDGPGLGVDVVTDELARHPYVAPGPRAGLPDRFVGDR